MSEEQTVWHEGIGVGTLSVNRIGNPYAALRPIFERLGIKEGDPGALKIDLCECWGDQPRLYPLDTALVALLDRLDKATQHAPARAEE